MRGALCGGSCIAHLRGCHPGVTLVWATRGFLSALVVVAPVPAPSAGVG